MHCSLYTRFNVENAGGDFSVGGARVCFRIPENPCSPRPAVAGRANPLPPVADFGMKEVRTKKKKHMTNDVNGMKKKCGCPALGRTRKLTRGVTVKFSPVSYEALRFRAGKSGRSLAVYIREAALAATVTARHTPEENALLRSLAGMANNLNQLTKLSHQTGFYRTRLLIEGLLGKLKRIWQGIKASVLMMTIYSAFMFGVLMLGARTFALLFVDPVEWEILKDTELFLHISVSFFPVLGLLCILRYSIQGAGFTNLAMLSGVSEMIARIMVSLYAVPALGYLAVCFGDPTAWIFAVIFLIPAFIYVYGRIKRMPPQEW